MPRALLPGALLVLVCGCAPADAAQPRREQALEHAGQRKSEERLVDHDLRFTLTRPGEDWVLLDESEVRVLNPRAVAGLSKRGRPDWIGLIFADPSVSDDIERATDLVEQALPLGDKRVLRREAALFGGLPAQRMTLAGLVNDLPARLHFLVTVRQGLVFRVVGSESSGPAGDEELFESMLTALRFDEGEVRYRGPTTDPADAHGIGWRIRDGSFQSAVHGYRVRPPTGWGLIHEDRLQRVGPDAEVGLVCTRLNSTFTLTAEPFGGEGPELIERARRYVRKELGASPENSITAECLGELRVLDEYVVEVEGLPFSRLHGVWVEGGTCFQIDGHFPTDTREQTLAELPAALRSFESLTAGEVEELTRALAGLPDQQNRVGIDFALRRGIFSDFAHGYRWVRPELGFWRIEVGASARQRGEGVRLYATELASGAHVLLMPKPLGDLTEESFHEQQVSLTAVDHPGRRVDQTEMISLAGKRLRRTRVHATREGIRYAFSVNTLVQGNLGLRCALYHFETNSRDATKVVEAAVRGLDWLEEPTLVSSSMDRYEDQRMGFRLDNLPKGVEISDITRAEARPMGTALVVRGAPASLAVMAMTPPNETLDEAWFVRTMQEALGVQPGRPSWGTPQRSRGEVSGQACTRLLWSGPAGDTEGLYLLRDRTF